MLGQTTSQTSRVAIIPKSRKANKPSVRVAVRAKAEVFKQERPVIRVEYLSKGYVSLEFNLRTFNCFKDEQTANGCELSSASIWKIFEFYLESLREEVRLRPSSRDRIDGYAERSMMTPFSGCLCGTPTRRLDELIRLILEASRRATGGCESCRLKNRQTVRHSLAA